MDNLQKSERAVATILRKLVEAGLQRIELTENDFEDDEEIRPFLTTSLDWLLDEGIISAANFEKDLGDGFIIIQPTLTSYGFNLMGQTFIRTDGSETKISDAVEEVSAGSRSYSQVGDFFGGLLGGFTKSMGS